MGARFDSASSTRAAMRPSVVSSPTLAVRISRTPSSFIVPAKTSLPLSLGTGIDSPVIGAWLTEAWPVTTSPSTGMASPERTSTRSPGLEGLDRHLLLDAIAAHAGGLRA